jgi:hypothetical protein
MWKLPLSLLPAALVGCVCELCLNSLLFVFELVRVCFARFPEGQGPGRQAQA